MSLTKAITRSTEADISFPGAKWSLTKVSLGPTVTDLGLKMAYSVHIQANSYLTRPAWGPTKSTWDHTEVN